MTGGKAGHVTLPCEWGSHCLTVAALPKHGTARRLSTTRKTHPSWNGGGGQGVFTVASPKNSTARRLATPLPPLISRKNQRCPSTALHVPYPPRKTHQLWNGGGETGGVHRGAAQEHHCKSPIPPQKNHHTCNGGRDQGVFNVASLKHGSARRLSPPTPRRLSPPTPPPPLMSWKIKNKNETYLSGGIPKAADDALKQG